MPNMIYRRRFHKSVAFKNKLFLIDGDHTKTCEVYDSISKKFVLLKSPDSRLINYNNYNYKFPEAVISIRSKFYVFYEKKSTCLIYDIENNTWSEEHFELKKNMSFFSCAKVPQC